MKHLVLFAGLLLGCNLMGSEVGNNDLNEKVQKESKKPKDSVFKNNKPNYDAAIENIIEKNKIKRKEIERKISEQIRSFGGFESNGSYYYIAYTKITYRFVFRNIFPGKDIGWDTRTIDLGNQGLNFEVFKNGDNYGVKVTGRDNKKIKLKACELTGVYKKESLELEKFEIKGDSEKLTLEFVNNFKKLLEEYNERGDWRYLKFGLSAKEEEELRFKSFFGMD